MKLELKNIKVNLSFSRETTCFQADIYVDGEKVGYAENDGNGGNTSYNAYEGKREKLKAAEVYAQSLPSEFLEFDGEKHELKMNLELWIDTQIDEYVNAKERAKFEQKIKKMCETSVVWGTPNSDSANSMGFKGKMNLAELYRMEKGKEAIDKLVIQVKGQLKEGEIIFNTNIPV